ncbi:MAG: hypothetical protein JWM48_923 [Mycobacterium sp.]|jgi:hypothetical protein|nr:hypothetical protein [Mycobacterium sp.]MCW2744373.1 hypothetical protein [Mycobacterium sp.]
MAKASEVTSRQFDPGTDWTLPEARTLLEQGYTPEHASRLTGWPVPMLLAQPRRPLGRPTAR